MWGRAVIGTVALLCAYACTAPARAAVPLSEQALLARLTSPVAAVAPLPAGVHVVQPSSHDLMGGNVDGGSYGGPITTGGIPPTYVRREDGGYVLLDVQRPGCLVREWMTANVANQGDLAGYGRLQLFIDGEDRPRVDVPAPDFFAGRDARFPRPLVGDQAASSGGNYSYVPVCFARSLKLRVTGSPSDAGGWWQSTLLLAPAGTPVESFRGADARAAAGALAHTGAAPARRPRIRASRALKAGDTVRIARVRGKGTLRYLRFRVAPFDAATLAGVSLRVAADGASRPQIDVPLGALFGDGLEVRDIHAAAFGMAPKLGEGYFALPVPYRRGATISLAASHPARVSLDGWIGRPAPREGTLYGERHETTTALGDDVRVLDTDGSGRLASLVLDVLDGGPLSGGAQYFMEGDERVQVDGARSPAIYGTGTEDAFNGGFYYRNGAFTLPTHGAGPLAATTNGDSAQSQYRVFGADGVRWSSGLRFGIEHGGGDERADRRYAVTTFSYRAPATLSRTDSVALGDAQARGAHAFAGAVEPRPLTAYFEGERDGNTPVSTVVVGGFYYPAPPAEASPEGFTADGAGFAAPISVTLRVDRRNRGVVLRRLTDQGAPLVPVAVSVDGATAGVWNSATAVPSPAKRWLEDDFALPPSLTARRSSVRVTLAPQGGTANLFALQAFSAR